MQVFTRRALVLALGAAVAFAILPSAARADSSLAAIKSRGVLKVGVKFDSPGWGYLDPKSGSSEPAGFDVDIAHALAKQILGDASKVQFVQVNSSNRIPQVQNGDIDMFIATATITAARMQQINFSNVYFRAGQSLLVNKKNTTITTYKDLAGLSVATAKGSTPEATIKRLVPTANVVTFDGYSDCFQALEQGRVDAFTTDNGILAGFLHQDPDHLKMVGGLFTFEPYGIGIALNNDSLTKAVNDGLAAIGRNGSYAAIYKKYIGDIPTDWSTWYDMPAKQAADMYAADQPKTLAPQSR